jgi:hypothetical protein
LTHILGARGTGSQRMDKITSTNTARNFGQVLINALTGN